MNKYEVIAGIEQQLLGCILLDPTLLEETTLKPEHFMNLQNRELMKSMLELKTTGEEISLISLAQLGESRALLFGGINYLSQLAGSVPSVEPFKNYEKSILHFYSVQAAINYANEFLNQTKETHKIQQLSSLIQNISKLEGDTVTDSLNFKQKLSNRMVQHLDSPAKGLSGTNTGFMNLNVITDGWQNGDLIIIGARPSMGKTAFALNSVLQGCKKDSLKATIFSIEMTEEAIIDRLIATEAGINVMKMRNPNQRFESKDWDRYTKAVGDLEKLDIDIRYESTVPGMRAAVRKNVKSTPDKKHIVVIDFLTLIQATQSKSNRNAEVEDIILELKQMAKDLHIPVIVISQLSRMLEQRKDKRPMLSDLRESGSIEQTADMVIFLYRDDYYDEKSKSAGITELLIAKNRNGKTGTLKMRFIKETNTFSEIIYDPNPNNRKLI